VADGWYVSCSCAEVPTRPVPLTGRETGIDVGLTVFLVTAEGDVVDHPRHRRQVGQGLKKAQQRVARRQQGSKRRAKAARQCAKRYQRVQRRRRDFHHQTALALVRAYDTIYVEAIAPANLVRRPAPLPDGSGSSRHNGARRKAGLNTSIHDAGWTAFLTLLAFTAAGDVYAGWKRSTRRTRRRMVPAAAHGYGSVSPCARMSVPSAAWS
jgi:putative transposase